MSALPPCPRIYVDDAEVWVEPDQNGWRLGVQINPEGDVVSHHLTAADAATLAAALRRIPATLAESPREDKP